MIIFKVINKHYLSSSSNLLERHPLNLITKALGDMTTTKCFYLLFVKCKYMLRAYCRDICNKYDFFIMLCFMNKCCHNNEQLLLKALFFKSITIELEVLCLYNQLII